MAAAELSKVIEHLRRVLVKQDAAGMIDGELLKRYLQQRDEAAFEALVRRHGPMVLGVCRRVLRNLHDAEDAFQATFLVLVRKGSTLRSPGMLGNWLYGVAYRTARQARRAALKRRAKEAKVVPRSGPPEDTWTDLRDLLDQELARLPEKYRAVVVLCDLEGATGKEAARHLALPEGTVASRLARGRAMLAKRLARHGLMLSAGSLAAALTQEAASACLPPLLVVSTVKAATLFAAGQAAAAGFVSAEVAALTKGVLTTMFLSKIKVALGVLLVAASLVTGTTVMMSQASGPDSQEKRSQASGPDENGRDTHERKAASPEKTPRGADKLTVSAYEIGNAYLTNMALFDENFRGKRIAVTGKMNRITREEQFFAAGPNATRRELFYSLEMGSLEMTSDGRPLRIYYPEMGSLDKTSDGRPRILVFRFTSDDRKQLAKLKAGQHLTIEGEPDPKDERTLRFLNCKIVNAKED